MSSSNSEISEATSSENPKMFDVFISFRGEDTRSDFTSHLYSDLCRKGINTFMDDNLIKGEEVWPALSQAIEQSHIALVVLSENYGTSRWCLKELVKILECRKDKGQIVIPVFYRADPSHVRKQTGSYEKAFAKYDLNLGNDESIKHEVSQWRSALSEAADISGWDSRSYKNNPEVIQNIVNDVLQKLYLRYPNELKGLVGKGKDKNCAEIESLLKNHKVIGIWGMGGIGKTTIAKVLFAKFFPQYDNVCFLENVREEASKKFGLEHLRDKLLFELLKQENPKSNVGFPFIMRRLISSRKVLIVLDDMEKFDQLEELCGDCSDLGPNSRIIITTRYRQLLIGRVDWIYEVKKWDSQDSLKLFSSKAFKSSYPERGFEDLSKRAVNYAGGIPLALKALGSFLHSKSCEFWESELSRLEKYPNEDIQNVLKRSYDGLYRVHKEIFLDIAFFFKGWVKKNVIDILDACGFYPASGIDVLEDKALITISNDNRIQMHDLLQEMGLDIVRQKWSIDPGRCSRLRDIEEICDVLENNKGTDVVEGIALDLSQIKDLHLSANAFNMMTNLRFLQLYIPWGKRPGNVYYPKAFKDFSDKLRYLGWYGYSLKSLPSSFSAKMLVQIQMPHSHLKELWHGMQELVNLEAIDLSESKKFMKLPDLSKASKLKWVKLSGCESLRDVHPSVLSMNTLVTLMLDRCKKLKSLKSEKHLRCLENISVNGCTSLKEFSISSDLIERLDLSNTGIEILHPSIGRLSNLTWLKFGDLRLEYIADELSLLTSLTILEISKFARVINKQKLHVLFDGLRSLEKLYLEDCRGLHELPDNISVLSKLRELVLDGSSVKRLPASIKHLQRLGTLTLVDCRKLHCLPELPPFITEFCAANCSSLVTVSTLKSFAVQMTGYDKSISFANNLKLDRHSLNCITEGVRSTMMRAAFHVRSNEGVDVCLPGSTVPWQFTHRTTGSSISIELPSASQVVGFVVYAVLPPSCGKKQHYGDIQCLCYLADDTKVVHESNCIFNVDVEFNSDHVYAWYDPYHSDIILSRFGQERVCFEFSVTTKTEEGDGLIVNIKACGVHLIYRSEFYTFLRELDLELDSKLDLGLIMEQQLGLGLDEELDEELDQESKRRALLKAIQRSDDRIIANGESIDVWQDNWPPQAKVEGGSNTQARLKVSHLLQHNRRKWDRVKFKNILSPKLAIRALPQCSSSYTFPGQLWSIIGKQKIPNKVKIFIWKCLHHAIPVEANLFSKKLAHNSLCPVCKGAPETVEHALLLCPWTRAVWFGSQVQCTPAAENVNRVEDWLWNQYSNLEYLNDVDYTSVGFANICNIMWSIWQGRNECLFKDKQPNPVFIISSASLLALSSKSRTLLK